ncbi:hypothetical protein M8C21_016455 [Ambrosia artemisiifolia]|uniref:Potassium transporter n=1 Tax=Ambrosia artemisiifolia TaxID=4212 RepID=A0AAD5GFT9_AMBAR|nr:hypothetical protein M8C21_016455 [Ambrosia artemisiifolia]
MDLGDKNCWGNSKVCTSDSGIIDLRFSQDTWRTTLVLAYQSLGVVYGDLSISPIYVYKSTFAADIHHSETNEEIFGVLSFVFWTLTLVPLFKYVFIVLRADDNGEGGTFALYSLICRHVKVSLLPNRQTADESLSTYKLKQPPKRENGSKVKTLLEKHKTLHTALLILVLLGTCMVIGDGVLTPVISVFSAVSGLELSMSKAHHEYAVIPITCFILVCLFALQHYGSHRIGFIFAPIVLLWLLCLSGLGLYNILYWDPHVYKALSPYYMYKFLKKTKTRGWMSLGGILLCITGSEAMFADLGHFSYAAIQIAFTFIVYPALILGYMGQAAYLSKHHQMAHDISYYVSVPASVRWPVIVIAILASVVGSQAIISGTFSIINQSQSLGCFPRVKVVHTSDKKHGQIYIPEINWILMILCIAVTIGFRDTKHMGNASGWVSRDGCNDGYNLPNIIELLYFSASLVKFREGAWLPILLALILVTVMFIWHYGTTKKVPGIGLVFTDLTSGIPANFSRFVTNLPAFHRILVFVCVKFVPVPFIPPAERYLIGRVGPSSLRSYRCIVRYGYRDVHQDVDSFESELVNRIADFIRYDWTHPEPASDPGNEDNGFQSATSSGECRLAVIGSSDFCATRAIDSVESLQQISVSGSFQTVQSVADIIDVEMNPPVRTRRVTFAVDDHSDSDEPEDLQMRQELEDLLDAQQSGTAFILGHSHVKTKQGSSVWKRLAINVGYNFLRRNCRGPDVVLKVPPVSMLEVGMVYVV